jgi:hypothetical protein
MNALWRLTRAAITRCALAEPDSAAAAGCGGTGGGGGGAAAAAAAAAVCVCVCVCVFARHVDLGQSCREHFIADIYKSAKLTLKARHFRALIVCSLTHQTTTYTQDEGVTDAQWDTDALQENLPPSYSIHAWVSEWSVTFTCKDKAPGKLMLWWW